MSDAPYDMAIIGAGALPALVAGLVATLHHRRVVLVSPSPSPYRLARGLDVALWPMTRPDRFALVERTSEETRRLIGRIGKGLFERRTIAFLADRPASIEALSHFRHLVRLSGLSAEPMRETSPFEVSGLRIRDVPELSPARAGTALIDWLVKSGVRHIEQRETVVSVKRDGSCRLTFAGLVTEAADTVLLGDEALLTLLPDDALSPLLVRLPRLAVLASPPRRALSADIVAYPDRAVLVAAQEPGGLLAFADGDMRDAAARIGTALPAGVTLPRIAETRFDLLASRDGAPVFGTARGGRARYAAALGPTGAFLAPALVRMLMGTAPAEEADWFLAHDAGAESQRTRLSEHVADAIPALQEDRR